MKERSRQSKTGIAAAAGGLVLILPLAILEWTTRSDLPRSDFPVVGFVYLWVLAALLVGLSIGTVRTALSMRGGTVAASRPVASLAARVGLLGLIAWASLPLVVDQWPCFLGATGC